MVNGRRIIDNSTPGFNNKIRKCLEKIFKFLNLPKATSFYQKLLLQKGMPWEMRM